LVPKASGFAAIAAFAAFQSGMHAAGKRTRSLADGMLRLSLTALKWFQRIYSAFTTKVRGAAAHCGFV
jgi:hypothetical protein